MRNLDLSLEDRHFLEKEKICFRLKAQAKDFSLKGRHFLTDVETWPNPSEGPCLASPKSESFALKSSSSRMLDVLKSRNISCIRKGIINCFTEPMKADAKCYIQSRNHPQRYKNNSRSKRHKGTWSSPYHFLKTK